MTDFWEELGLQPTADLQAIRHAYAQKSKIFHPEEAPENFQRLHEAYQAACQWAKAHQQDTPMEKTAVQPEQDNSSYSSGEPDTLQSEKEEWSNQELEDLIAAGLDREKKKNLRRYGKALSCLYQLARNPQTQEDLSSWQLLLQGPVFAGLAKDTGFYPFLQQFCSDHYEFLPDGAWLAIRQTFSLGVPNLSPEAVELSKLVLPRCQRISVRKFTSASKTKYDIRDAGLILSGMVILFVLFSIDSRLIFFLLGAGCIILLLFLVILKKRRKR